jgi:hypothetical protein
MPIMEEKSVILVTGKRFPELLHGPFRSRMFGHVAVNETSGSDLKSNEHIKHLEAGRDGDKEIASNDSLRMVADERRPALVLRSAALR